MCHTGFLLLRCVTSDSCTVTQVLYYRAKIYLVIYLVLTTLNRRSYARQHHFFKLLSLDVS